MTYLKDVVYVDPTGQRTDRHDALAATPHHPADPGLENEHYGCISVVHGVVFSGNAQHTNSGRSQSVCINPEDVNSVLAALGDRLRGVGNGRGEDHDSGNTTIVITVAELEKLAEDVSSSHGFLGPNVRLVAQLMVNDLMTTVVNQHLQQINRQLNNQEQGQA